VRSIAKSSLSARPSPDPARAYIVLSSDFDIFPFLFDLFSSTDPQQKVVCFVKEITPLSFLVEQVGSSSLNEVIGIYFSMR
jgi:hypothetical protein